MNENPFSRLLVFLERLRQAKIPFTMEPSRDDAIMVTAIAPGEYWEIEFLEDGEIEIERFRSNGHLDDEAALDELFALCSDEDSAAEPTSNQHDAITRK